MIQLGHIESILLISWTLENFILKGDLFFVNQHFFYNPDDEIQAFSPVLGLAGVGGRLITLLKLGNTC